MPHSIPSDFRSLSAAARPLPATRGKGTHTAHFYVNDPTLVTEVGQRFAAALAAGGAAVVIADAPHRNDLAQFVETAGIDLGRAAVQGRWLALDARKTLNEFMVGDAPDPQRFGALIGGILDRLAAALSMRGAESAPVIAYGEMVALLWKDGNTDAAARVEDLWNDLQRTRTFHLSCGWPLRFFSAAANGIEVDRILSQHTHATPSLSQEPAVERKPGASLWQLKAHTVLEHVSQISRQTLGFYRGAGSPVSVSISEATEEVLSIFRSHLTVNEISVRKKIGAGLSVRWPRGECKQILSGLIANAIDASFPGAAIYLASHECRHPITGVRGVRFTAGDQGVGIPPAMRPDIFTPFSRVRKDINIGLGLWSIKDLLGKRGGYIHCRSRVGASSGTLMSVFLPAEPILHAA